MNNEIIQEVAKLVYNRLYDEKTGHNWFHSERVWKNALYLAKKEGGNRFVIQIAALVHDLIDDKLDPEKRLTVWELQYLLSGEGVTDKDTQHILEIVQNLSFSKNKEMQTLEGKIVQDADRLDAIGAIGIARTFTYSGARGQTIFDPSIEVRDEMTQEEYRHGKSSTIHHFYEKLLKLKELMNTDTARIEAEKRHTFMEAYLEQFYSEWDIDLNE